MKHAKHAKFFEARQIRHLMKHAMHVSTPSTQARKVRQAREQVKHASTPSTWARQARKARKARKSREHTSTPLADSVKRRIISIEYCFGIPFTYSFP